MKTFSHDDDRLCSPEGGAKRAGNALLSIVGSFGSAITVAFCPVCYPAIGALLAAAGLGFVVNEAALRPMLLTLIALSWFGFFWSYRTEHRRLSPLIVGFVAGVGLYAGRYIWFSEPLMYAGIIGMIGAGMWNLFLRKRCKGSCRCS